MIFVLAFSNELNITDFKIFFKYVIIKAMALQIFTLIVLLFSIIIHEIAHGGMAYSLGDPTAKYSGRLSLNPIKHIDPVGSVLVPLALALVGAPLIGWAKPVPINPNNFRDKKWGDLKVGLAGPASNLIIALVFGLALRLLPVYFFNLFGFYFIQIAVINILLAVFNLMPIPPLDGSHILFSFLPRSAEKIKIVLSQYGFLILFFFIFFFSWFRGLLWYLINIVFTLITGMTLPYY